MHPRSSLRTFTVLLFVLLRCVSPCLADVGQSDPDLAGMPLNKLQGMAKSCDATSKNTELRMYESEAYQKDRTVRRLKGSAAILKDENEKTVLEMMHVVDREEYDQGEQIRMVELIKAWLQKNCLEGTTLYFYSRKFDASQRSGYCVVKDGVVRDSLILEEGAVATYAPNFAVPLNLAVEVEAAPTQPADYPVVITLHLTVIGQDPFAYWCGGPGTYPTIEDFTPKITDDKGRIQAIKLENGQRIGGPGRTQEMKSGETLEVPASLGLLPVGTYTIQVGDAKPVKVEVKVDPELSKKRLQELRWGTYNGDQFLKFLAVDYGIKAVIDVLQKDITDENIVVAEQALLAFPEAYTTPQSFEATIRQAINQQLKSTEPKPKRYEFMNLLVHNLRGDDSDETLETLLTLLATDLSKVPELDSWPGNMNKEDVKVTAVQDLGVFKQQRAIDELHRLLNDSDLVLRTTAAQVLADNADPAGKEILHADLLDWDSVTRYPTFVALLNFSDDPGYEALLQCSLHDSNRDIREAAEDVVKRGSLKLTGIVEKNSAVSPS